VKDLPPVPELAVIINVQTKYFSTLALLSALRHLKIPTVIIDCESKDGSFDWFQSLQADHDFHLTRAPLRPHGAALDWIFQSTTAESILLVDSDMEILNGEMFEVMRTTLREKNAYGAGYFQKGSWLEIHYGTEEKLAPGIGFYKSRPWIPFAMFRVEPVRRALASGASFKHALVLNDVPQLPVLSRLLFRRFRFPFFRRRRLSALNMFRRQYEAQKPAYVFFDTGAQIHDVLSAKGMSFGDVGAAIPPWSVKHLEGVTRDLLQGHSSDSRNAAAAGPAVLEKLKDDYGVTPPQL
jgi:glycosyltransferase involved in cell wall biosynthesis